MHLRKDINKKAPILICVMVAWLLYSQYRDQLPKSIIHVVSCMLPTSYYPYSSLNTVRTAIKPFINVLQLCINWIEPF